MVAFFARLRGVPVSSAPVVAGFLPDRSARIGTLSGGQRQRLTMAIALLGRPAVLLLDEPVSNLDAAGRESVWEMLRELRGGGTTVLIASPSPADLAGVGDRTVMLHDGRVVDDVKCIGAAGCKRHGKHERTRRNRVAITQAEYGQNHDGVSCSDGVMRDG